MPDRLMMPDHLMMKGRNKLRKEDDPESLDFVWLSVLTMVTY